MASRFASVFARTRIPTRSPLVPTRNLHRHESDLLQQLSGVLGVDQARQELRWMRESLDEHSGSPHSTSENSPSSYAFRYSRRNQPRVDQAYFRDAMAAMVQRRLKGEPLQYILGM
jgi:hypothetical protein